MKPLYWKILLILGTIIVGASLLIPKALRKNAQTNLDDIPHTELILEVDEEYLLKDLLRRESYKLFNVLSENDIRSTVRRKDGALIVGFRSNAHYEAAKRLLGKSTEKSDGEESARNITVETVNNRQLKIQFTPQYIQNNKINITKNMLAELSARSREFKADAMQAGPGKIRFRYAGETNNKLSVLLEQIRNPVQLGFYEVRPARQEELERCVENKICPPGTKAYPQKNGQGYMLVRNRAIISNTDLRNVSEGLHPNNAYPIINFKYNARGARKFCDFTANHVGEPFAVVINDEIITAPIINGAICGGSGFIQGGFTMEAAENLALSLNAGTLPTRMRVVRERAVVPSSAAKAQK